MDCEDMGRMASSFVLLTIGIAVLGVMLGIISRNSSYLSYISQEIEVSEQAEETEVVTAQDTPTVDEDSKPTLELEPIDWAEVRNMVFAIIGAFTCFISGVIGISNAFTSFCMAKEAFKDNVPDDRMDTLMDMYTYDVNAAKYALAIELIGLSLILI